MSGETAERFGRFEIVDTLGAGGFSTVHLADDPNFEQPVALKVLDQRWCEDLSVRRRFIAEAKIMRRLARAGLIIAIHDVIEDDGCPALVMEYCERGSLAQRLADLDRTLTVDEGRALAGAIADAVGGLHQAGVVHRDLKPSNLLIRVRPGPGPAAVDGVEQLLADDEELVVGDYGLAKVVDREATGITLAGGSPGYSPPEQFAAAADVDQRADVYAASAVVIAAMAGTEPHPGIGGPAAFDEAAWLATGPLRPALTAGMALDRDDRPPNIEGWSDALTTGAARGRFGPRVGRLAFGRRGLVAAIGLVVLAAVGLVVWPGLGPGRGGPSNGKQTVAAEAQAQAQAPAPISTPASVSTSAPDSDPDSDGVGRELSLGEPVSGSLTSEELVRFDFTVEAGQRLFFETWVGDVGCDDRGDPGMSWRLTPADQPDVHLFNAYTSAPDSEACVDTDRGPVEFDQAGRYSLFFFYLGECGLCRGSYSFVVHDVPEPQRFRIEVDQLVSLDSVGPGSALIETPGAVDIYELEVEAGDRLTIEHWPGGDPTSDQTGDAPTGDSSDDLECGEGDPGLVLLLPEVGNDDAFIWSSEVTAPGCQVFEVGPFTVQQDGILTLRYAYRPHHAGVGPYSFAVRRAD